MSITIERAGIKLDYKCFTFSGGEVSIKLDAYNYAFWQFNKTSTDKTIDITARIHSSDDVMALAQIVDAIRLRIPNADIELFMPYVPYGRQDRACAPGESFSLKVFTNIINSLNFSTVKILDPHSDVTPALINNVRVVTSATIIPTFDALNKTIHKNSTRFVSPDAGANKKTSELAKLYAHDGFIRADKLRNLNTGEILETVVYEEDLSGVTAVIVDDICDGGRTFIELAKVLNAKNAAQVILYVTHGIFSNGVDIITSSGIDHIYTTDSFRQDITHDKVTVLKVYDHLILRRNM